ncbi:MAG: hypothetical protein IT552_14010 [Sphingomonadaceae bacterium]|nr:hypothetical protein [Sphingomonadaceae bacterium]
MATYMQAIIAVNFTRSLPLPVLAGDVGQLRVCFRSAFRSFQSSRQSANLIFNVCHIVIWPHLLSRFGLCNEFCCLPAAMINERGLDALKQRDWPASFWRA